MARQKAFEHGAKQKRTRTFEREFVNLNVDLNAAAEYDRSGARQPLNHRARADPLQTLDLTQPPVELVRTRES